MRAHSFIHVDEGKVSDIAWILHGETSDDSRWRFQGLPYFYEGPILPPYAEPLNPINEPNEREEL